MNKNVRIAKELVKLAKSLVADNELRKTVKFMDIGNACQCVVEVGCTTVVCNNCDDDSINAFDRLYGTLDINTRIVGMKTVFNSVKEDIERIFGNDFTILDGTKKDYLMDNGSVIITTQGVENVKKLVDLCNANKIHVNFVEEEFTEMGPGSAENIYNACVRHGGEIYETLSGNHVTKQDYELAMNLHGNYTIKDGKVVAC